MTGTDTSEPPSAIAKIDRPGAVSPLAQAIDLLASPTMLIGPDGRCTRVNRAWTALTGQPAADAAGAGWLDALHPADRADAADRLADMLVSHTARPLTLRLRTATGGWRTIDVDCSPLPATDGRPGGLVAAGHDVTVRDQAETRARAQADELRRLANTLPAMIAHCDTALRYTFANRTYCETYGRTEADVIGRTIAEVIGIDGFNEVAPRFEQVMRGEPVNYQRILPGTLPPLVVDAHLVPHHDGSGRLVGAFILASDITRHHDAERALRDREERLNRFAAAVTDGILFHRHGVLVDCNEAAPRIFGCDGLDGLRERGLGALFDDPSGSGTRWLAADDPRPYEIDGIRADGSRVPLEMRNRVMPGAADTRMTVVRDISERKDAEARIHFLAHHDGLTRLPNRLRMMDELETMLRAGRRRGTAVAVLFIDLDRFKTVNDSLGHHAGDTLLRNVADRLRATVRRNDLVARIGGDEFVVVVPDLAERGDIGPIANHLLDAVSGACTIDGHSISVTPSIGISVFPDDGQDSETLLRNADAAMYHAKHLGRATCQFFTPALNAHGLAKLTLEGELREALRQRQFQLHFQPQVSLRTGAIVRAEALIRWNHPVRGRLAPDVFLDVAEERGLAHAIGQWVIEEALDQSVRWRDNGLTGLPVAINVSPAQLRRGDLLDHAERCLGRRGLSGDVLELELAESALMDDVEDTIAQFRALRTRGIRFAIDDFGTGYAPIGYLTRFPIDRIKIDSSFVAGLPHAADSVAITGAIIDMAHGLGITLVAEGVETAQQRDFLRARRCDEMSGYLVSPPLPADQFEAFVRTARTLARPARGFRPAGAAGRPGRTVRRPGLAPRRITGVS